MQNEARLVSRVLYPEDRDGDHSSRPSITARLKRSTRNLLPFDVVRAARELAIPYLILHREEFTWPRLLPDAPVSSYLTVSPITFFKAGLFSVALVVMPISQHAR